VVAVSAAMPLAASEIFDCLVDPRTYPHWLVGARDIRAVDEQWPEPGAAFHHRVGLIGPLKIADSSEVVEIDQPRLLVLEVRARPLGRAMARFALAERARPTRTTVTFDEVLIGGLRHLSALLDPITARRNQLSLTQLEDFLINGQSHRAPG
jgi:uncharacterized protein YndB with AHSA1/START domain